MKKPPEDPRVTATLATATAHGNDYSSTAAVLNFTVTLAGLPKDDVQRLYAAIHGCIVAILPPEAN